ncbi:hypothetical protein PR202_ga03109 [Eleusine coracana subsp. coracana]|uniref:Transmembrane protein n=1 Tax=Eleusine coracana subsp. coracana TaxID=191504 RepID=A0AAV5BL61_ELECO|nr:hypothetical protein PR202_ga03109 [Eleusine coracana subsp. coracana]
MVAFAVALLMGTAVYFRIWARQSSDPSFTVDDREELRRQFERANLEAMDESAEWRMKYDTELEKSKQLQDELSKDYLMLKRQTELLRQQCNCTVPLSSRQG